MDLEENGRQAAANGRVPTANEYLVLLLVGLFPILGLVFCLRMVYSMGKVRPAAVRSLARAMLWLHGAGLCAAIIALCVWVIRLATFAI